VSASPAELLARRVAPSAVIALSRVTWPARAGAGARRRLGRRGRVELFFAFDDPCSAIAVLDLAGRLSGREVRLLRQAYDTPEHREAVAGFLARNRSSST